MLEQGFHKSFSELFNLIQQQKSEHERAGPAAVLLEPLINTDHTKLEYLRVQLTAAEDAERMENFDGVYMALRSLAQYFERNQGTWLSIHFYQRSLEIASRITGDNQRAEGEGQCNVGLAMEKRGELKKAAGHFEVYQKLAHKHKWCTDTGLSVYEVSCEHLRRVYTSMAKQIEADDPQEAISLLKRAHEMARESRDSQQEGLACYRLGKAYHSCGDNDTAIQYHKKYLEWCKYHKDNMGAGMAYEALAKCHETKGDTESAIKHLEMYVEVAQRAGDQRAMARACSAIGMMYNTLGDYENSVQFFGRCYELCTQLNDPATLHEARVQYGIARGHQLFQDYSATVSCGGDSVQQLIAWKDDRATGQSADAADRSEEQLEPNIESIEDDTQHTADRHGDS
jgi:tetratricopeptide (TPR) repeat protein